MPKTPKQVGVGIIGYSVGRTHAHGWRGIREVFDHPKALPRLVAISGRTAEKVNDIKERFGFERSYANWRKLVADKDVDVVDNCAPPYLHEEATVAAAEAGKDLICEKPMARTAKEAKAMLDAARRARVAHMVGYNYRFVSAIAFAKKLIEEGRLGRVYYYKGSYLNSYAGYHLAETPFDWHHSFETGGYGALADLGTHAIDLARFLAGEFATVHSVSRNFVGARPRKGESGKGKVDVDDATISAVTFESGAVGMIEASWMTPGRRDFLAFEIFGSKGSLRFELERIDELQVYLEGDDPTVNGPREVLVLEKEHPFMNRYWFKQAGGFSWENTFVNELNHYLQRLVEGKSVAPEAATFLDGYRNCVVMDAMMKSAKTGKRVEIVN